MQPDQQDATVRIMVRLPKSPPAVRKGANDKI